MLFLFSGKSTIFMPFVYYRFLSMRYQSRRNPYNRIMFYELRVAIESFVANPNCPVFVRNLIQRLIGVISRLAPPTI